MPILDDRGTLIGVAEGKGPIDNPTSWVLIEKLYYNSTGLMKSFTRRGKNGKFKPTLNKFRQNIARSKYLPFGWTGMYKDRFTGLYHTHFREYDPIHGRWLSQDPAGYRDGYNLYAAYMGVNGIDPLGLALYAFDGTNNYIGQKDRGKETKTNVRKFFEMYKYMGAGKPIYLQGVGNPDDYSGLVQKAGLIGGYKGGAIIDRAMKRLRQNFKAGDTTIDIVGFSRGSALALEFAHRIQDEFPEAKIRFLGLWDTVGAMGLANNPAQLPADAVEHYTGSRMAGNIITSMISLKLSLFASIPDSVFQKTNIGYRLSVPNNVITAYHAMAINENRDAFDVTRLPAAFEMWFYGVHSNIGGGYIDTGLSDITLKWMLEKAKLSGLQFESDTKSLGFEIKPNIWGELRNEKSGLYGEKLREIKWGDKIHPSARFRLLHENGGYMPDFILNSWRIK